jgi:hypothetical protein
MSQERRHMPRYPLHLDALMITPEETLPVQLLDISACGIRLASPEGIPPETDVALSLITGEEILLSGTVLWAMENPPSENFPSYEVGVEAQAFILRDQEIMSVAGKWTAVRDILSRIHPSAA